MQPIIRARTREWGAVLLVCLFFVKQIEGGNAAVASEAGRNRHETRELTLALQALQQEKELLQARLERQELRLKTLQEALAIARTESALFQERWTEAELRAKALGVDVSEADDRQWQRTVVESVRALYHAEDEKQLCMEQLERVLKAVDRDDVEQLTVVLNDAEAILLNQGLNQQLGSKTQTVPVPEATLGQARVMDVNATLGVVVLNIGRQQGTRVGMPFMVLDGDNVIAYLRVIEVRRRIAGAIIEDRIADAEITPGQAVRVSER